MSKLSDDVLVVCSDEREQRFFPRLQMAGRGHSGASWQLAGPRLFTFRKGKSPWVSRYWGACTHTHKDTCKGIQQFYLWCTHMRTHRSPRHMRTLPKRLNRLIAGTPLRKQQPNYHHILHQGQHTHIHHFTCANHTPLLLTKPLGSNKSS